MITSGRALAFRPDVVATLLDDGAVLLDLETKYFYELNRCGWDVASLFESGATVETVLAHCRAWGAPAEDDDAVMRVIETLIDDGLVDGASDEATATATVTMSGPWMRPTIERQAEPLQKIIISAFDPSVPLVE